MMQQDHCLFSVIVKQQFMGISEELKELIKTSDH